MNVYWDVETYSQCNLKDHGAYIYAADPSTGVFFLCYAIDDGEIEVWKPGDPVATPFANPAGYKFVADNFEFERCISTHILIPRYGFAPIRIEQTDCAERLALANAYPAELGLRCEALGLPYRKDQEARKAMLRLSRPQTVKKRKQPEDPTARDRDLALLLERCKNDVRATRAVYNSPRLRPLLPAERRLLLLDAEINAQGICGNIPFLEAARTLATQERNAVNTRLNELTAGVITSVDQVRRIMETVNNRGHGMTSLDKRSVAATLAHQPDGFVRELLELRQRGAFASTRKFKKLLDFTNPNDHRIRGSLRIYGAGPGRWSSIGAQLHNLPRNDGELPSSLINALIASDRAELARYGNPLRVVSGVSRAALCAAQDHELHCADFSSIESRVTTWLAGETWKLENFRRFDAAGDKNLDLYRVLAHRILKKNTPVSEITTTERQVGKCAELACGFGGSVGAWRRIAGDDGRSDAEVQAIIRAWRDEHPAIRAFWHDLAQAARVAIRTGRPILVAPAPRPPIIAAFDGYALTLTLPSGRAINYPGAHLTANTKFEDGDPDIEFFDNARGQWKPVRAWFGTLVENVVQATARDLLAAAIIRAEARGWSVVFHCHDEVVIEAPKYTVAARDVLALLLETPPWAAGLPLGGKVHSGLLYLEAPATAEPPAPKTEQEIVERAVDTFIAATAPNPAIARSADEDFLASLGDTLAPLTDFVALPMDASGRVSCPFHDDPQPSCKIYSDHFHCFGCDEHGDRINWLTRVEGMTRTEAIAALQDWSGPACSEQRHDTAERVAFALRLWNAALPLVGTLGERYLAETRGIDVGQLPASIHETLRFHPSCPFGARAHHPCIVALMRDPQTDVPVGIHRIGLQLVNDKVSKLDRMALGRMGVVKLWPAGQQLVIGEGIETTLAAATRIFLPGRSADAGLVGGGTRGSRLAAGAARCAASHPLGRQRCQRRRPKSCRALPTSLACHGTQRGAAGAQAGGLGLQRRGVGEAGVSDFDDDIEEMPESTEADVRQSQHGPKHTLADFRAYAPARLCIYMPCKEPWPNASIDARLPPQPMLDETGTPVRNAKGKVLMIAASKWLEQNQSVEQMTWAPGLPELIEDRLVVDGGWIERPGATCLNLYRPPRIQLGDASKAQRWVGHFHKIYPDDAVHAIAWLAQRVQHPEIKINHALVLGGAPGIGKDSLLEAVKHIVAPWNFHEVTPTQLIGKNNAFLRSVIVRLNEAATWAKAAESTVSDSTITARSCWPRRLMCCASTRSTCANITSSMSWG
jgi:DNA polymerase